MTAHLRANLFLLVVTLIVCSVLYPLVVLAVGQGLFPAKASGSLVAGPKGNIVGSRLIAQEFKGDEWFQVRPSAAGYNAAASSGSNYGANNPKLRDRAARQLGAMVSYRADTQPNTVQKDIESFFAAKPGRLAQWLKAYPSSAANWLADSDNAKAIEAWSKAHPGEFFETFQTLHPNAFPSVDKDTIVAATTGPAIHAAFFEMWLQANPAKAKDLVPVKDDAVTASGSGLDPHITLTNAKDQRDRVVSAWATKTGKAPSQIGDIVDAVLKDVAFEPLAGLAGGEAIVNVLEVNLELARQFSKR